MWRLSLLLVKLLVKLRLLSLLSLLMLVLVLLLVLMLLLLLPSLQLLLMLLLLLLPLATSQLFFAQKNGGSFQRVHVTQFVRKSSSCPCNVTHETED